MDNSEALSSHLARTKKIVHVSIIGIIWNLVLVAFKATIGLIIGSVAIVTDALNNLTDAFSSVVTIIGAKLGAKAPDKKHPYGYGQIEYLSSVVIAVLILYTGITSIVDSVEKIITPADTHYDTAAIVIIIGGVIVKLFLGAYFKRQGKEIESEALTASGTDATFDAIVSSSILVSAVINLTTGYNIDGWLGALIGILIVKAGIDVLRDSLSSIIGERISGDLSKELKKEINAFPEVEGTYDLILNQYGPQRTIGSVHIQVPDNMNAKEIDVLSRQISTEMYQKHDIIMTIGIYAAGTSSPESKAMREELMELKKAHPEVLQIHGFYVDEDTKDVSFDMVISFDCKDPESLKNEFIQSMKQEFPAYHFSAVIDSDFSD